MRRRAAAAARAASKSKTFRLCYSSWEATDKRKHCASPGISALYIEKPIEDVIVTFFFNILWGLVPGIVRWVPGFVRWVLGIVCWVLGFVRWVLGLVFWVLGIVCWVSGFVFWVSGLVFWVLGLVFWVSVGMVFGRRPCCATGRLGAPSSSLRRGCASSRLDHWLDMQTYRNCDRRAI